MRLALVHEYLIKNGGAERVLDQFLLTFKNPKIFTLLYSKKGTRGRYEKQKIAVSFLQKYPFSRRKYLLYLPLMPAATESLNLDPFEIVISSSHSFAKGVIVSPRTLHICYCHTPTRFLWHDRTASLKRFKNPIAEKVVSAYFSELRKWDLAAAQRVDVFVANSKNVKKRIFKYYRRQASVIYPPVNTDYFRPIKNPRKDFFLIVSRLEPHKKVDLAIAAFNHLPFKLKIIGTGSEFKKLKKLASKNIEFLGHLSDNKIRKYYQNCRAFILPQEEDFGITALEAESTGRPVIALAKGGARETIVASRTGIFFARQDSRSLAEAVAGFKEKNFKSEEIRKYALKFSNQIFRKKWSQFVFKQWNKFLKKEDYVSKKTD